MIDEEDVNAFLEHVGVKGMHWGVRGTRRFQKKLDRLQRIEKGKASIADRLLAANRGVIRKKSAGRQLQRLADLQSRVNHGHKKATNFLMKVGGVRLNELNTHKSPSNPHGERPKLDNGQKAALGFVAAYGAVSVASLMARNG